MESGTGNYERVERHERATRTVCVASLVTLSLEAPRAESQLQILLDHLSNTLHTFKQMAEVKDYNIVIIY